MKGDIKNLDMEKKKKKKEKKIKRKASFIANPKLGEGDCINIFTYDWL